MIAYIVTRVLIVAMVCLAAKLAWDFCSLKWPRPYVVVATHEVGREHRPTSDVLVHVFLFLWLARMLPGGTEHSLFKRILAAINKPFLTWDIPFAEQGLGPEAEVLEFCKKWGVPLEPWVWAKSPGEYTSANDFFTRALAPAHMPERNLGTTTIVSPATAVVTWFPSAHAMPRLVKNDRFTLSEAGIPDHEKYGEIPCALFYLAPADYHCYHSPVSGRVTFCELLNQDCWSVTVKPYIYSHINILSRNRRAVVVIQTGADVSVAMVIVGGVTVDSIRLDPCMRVGTMLAKGQRVGSFARGGSAIAVFFSSPIRLEQKCQDACALAGVSDFKVECGTSLAEVA